MPKREGYRNVSTKLVADHLFSRTDLAEAAASAAKRWLTSVQLGAGLTIAEVIPALADEVEAIISSNLECQIVGNGLASELLREALAEVDWRTLAVELVKQLLDELTDGDT
jgi:hypothetical protein